MMVDYYRNLDEIIKILTKEQLDRKVLKSMVMEEYEKT